VYEQWELVPKLLESLSRQTLLPHQWEGIIVDNGSSKADPAMVHHYGFRFATCDQPGSYAARNAGAALAQGQLLAFTDADCLPQPGWLSALYAAFVAHGAGLLYAGSVTVPRPEPLETWTQLYDVAGGLPQDLYVRKGHAATANLAIPYDIFAGMGGFDSRHKSGGDTAFCGRALAAGYDLRYVPDAELCHPPRKTFAEVVLKRRRIKGGLLRNGSARERLYYLAGALAPPMTGLYRIATSRRVTVLEKLILVVIRLRLWGTEMMEVARLVVGASGERR